MTTELRRVQSVHSDSKSSGRVKSIQPEGNKIFNHCMQMSNSIEKGKVYDVGFHWGKKRERGVTTEEVHYESFTYDGVEYFLYDCVYLHKEGEPEPYIGKLIRIWEHPNKGRRVLVLWFFRPSDISNYLGCQHVLENELFLACGNGVGLANENSLEAIGGKCSVVCISKDERNWRPSEEEIKMADYIFHQTFDVGSFTISDKLGEKIASIEVGFLLNKKDIRLSDLGNTSKAYSDNAVQGIQKPLLSILDTSEAETIKPDANRISLLVEDNNAADMLDKVKSIKQRGDAGPDDTCPAASAATDLAAICNQQTRLKSVDCNQTYLDTKSVTNDGITGIKGFDKSKFPDSVKMLDKKAKKGCGKNDCVDADTNDIKHSVPSTSFADKGKSEFGKDFESIGGTCSGLRKRSRSPYSDKIFLDNAAKSAANVQVTGNKGFCKFKCDDSAKMSDEKAKNNLGEKAVVDSNTNCMKDSGKSACSVEKGKSKFAKDFDRPFGTMQKMKPHCDASEGNLSKKLKLDDTAVPSCNNGVNGTRKLGSASIVREVGSRPAAAGKVETSIMGKKASRPAAAVKAGTSGDAKLAIESNSLSMKLESKGVMGRSNGELVNASPKESKDVKIDANGQVNEVSHRSLDKSNWFKPVPWQERMKDAQEEGTLILLQNLDPAYTSSEVEEMISKAFGEGCTAKMVQHTAMSSPHSGQAFVAFKTRRAAEWVINNLEQRCLMLPDGRPVVGSFWVASFDEKQSQFPGHLVIDKLRRQTQRESKAVSTSHSSQPNTLEYEMAVEWRLLQDRADFCWKKLSKQHEYDLKNLVSRLKRKKQNAVE